MSSDGEQSGDERQQQGISTASRSALSASNQPSLPVTTTKISVEAKEITRKTLDAAEIDVDTLGDEEDISQCQGAETHLTRLFGSMQHSIARTSMPTDMLVETWQAASVMARRILSTVSATSPVLQRVVVGFLQIYGSLRPPAIALNAVEAAETFVDVLINKEHDLALRRVAGIHLTRLYSDLRDSILPAAPTTSTLIGSWQAASVMARRIRTIEELNPDLQLVIRQFLLAYAMHGLPSLHDPIIKEEK